MVAIRTDKEGEMPKSITVQIFDDVYTLARTLANAAKRAMTTITLPLNVFGLASNHILIVAPDADSERVAWEIIDVLTS